MAGVREREQLAAEIVDALKGATPADRKSFEEGFGLGFFPSGIVERVRGGLR